MSASVSTSRLSPSPVPLLHAAESSNTARAARAGDLVRIGRGTYAPAESWSSLTPWARYLARVHGVARMYPDAVFVGESGCALRGLPVFGEPPDVHILLPSPTKSRRMAGIRVHASERMPRAENLDGILVASAEEVAVEIARTRHPAVGLAVADAVLRSDAQSSGEHLERLSAELPSSRGVRAARWVFSRASGIRETPLESVSSAAIEWLGFPEPELQVWFRGASAHDDARVDFWWRRLRLAGESDGEVKYSGLLGDARRALADRNARDAMLHARGVRATAHWSWRDVAAPAQLRALLTAVGLPIVHPERGAPLASLATALRGSASAGAIPSAR